MTRPQLPEHTHAALLMRAVRGAEATWPELRWFAAVPNGARVARGTARKLKAEGMNPGVPDYLFPVRRGEYVGLAIELKTDTGRASPEQRAWLAHLEAEGWRAVLCRGWEQAWAVVRDYLAAEPDDESAHIARATGGAE